MTEHNTTFPPLMETQSPPSSFWPPPPLSEPSQPLNYMMSPLQFNFFTPPPPSPFSDQPEAIDLSPLGFVLALVAVVAIPALLYTFFFSIKCPSNLFRRRSRSSVSDDEEDNHPGGFIDPDVVSGVKYQKDNHVKDVDSECPVCLSVFTDGEDIKQLSACKHSFHASCIDMWLNSHNNCPLCRAFVAVKHPDDNNNRVVPSTSRTTRRDNNSNSDNNDRHQGMPDAANLV